MRPPSPFFVFFKASCKCNFLAKSSLFFWCLEIENVSFFSFVICDYFGNVSFSIIFLRKRLLSKFRKMRSKAGFSCSRLALPCFRSINKLQWIFPRNAFISAENYFTPIHFTPYHFTPYRFILYHPTHVHFTPRSFHPTFISPHVLFTLRSFHPTFQLAKCTWD